MNTVITSREAILVESRKLVMQNGISSLNMRTVANACGVAVGSIYNYFPSKSDLIHAAVSDIWRDIFHMSGSCTSFTDFRHCITWMFESIRNGSEKYPGFFSLHSMSFTAEDKGKGREMMEHVFVHIRESLSAVLEQDPLVRADAFDIYLTKEGLIELVLTQVMSMLLRNQNNLDPLLEMVSRCIYE